jgi:hypothetical protein
MLPGFQMLEGFIVYLLGLCLSLQKKKVEAAMDISFASLVFGCFSKQVGGDAMPKRESRASKLQKCNSMDV